MAAKVKAVSKSPIQLAWNAAGTPKELAPALRELAKGYPVKESGKGLKLKFVKSSKADVCKVSVDGGEAVVEYGRPNMALRAVGSLLSGVVAEGGRLEDRCPFSTFGIMLDCSRNAVMTVERLKEWLKGLSLLGYNMAMLYTEDTYELPDEPFFGYMRGAYTAAELKEMDSYAAKLGIEMIPCIQTLGHLEQILSWHAYGEVKDTGSVLLVDEEKTYKLIDKMVSHWGKVFKSRRIHVGMDETHDLGRGRFYDRFGHECHFDIFNRHLAKVVDICGTHGLKPMIWSDMYFRMGSKTGQYYDKDCVIPKDVVKAIPGKAELVYWDYYHPDKEFYLDWIARHRKMGHEPLMGSGVWTWMKFWHDMALTERNGGACIDACREAKVKEVFFTMWGDDGGYCDFLSASAGLALMAEKSFTGKACAASLSARLKALFGSDYAASLEASKMESVLSPKNVLWDDPLLLIHMSNERQGDPSALKKASASYAEIAKRLSKAKSSVSAGDLRLAALLAESLAAKTQFAESLISAYRKKDKRALAKVRASIPALDRKLQAFNMAFRGMWLRNNKPFGLETMQIRMAGQSARLKELAIRLGEEPTSIPELDANLGRKAISPIGGCYRRLASGSLIL